jgi:hypothetical protein
MAPETLHNGSLKGASINRLACLLRHWTWADDALGRFERQLAGGWEDDSDPQADHLFGTYYHWCALLCGLSEAAIEHAALSGSHLTTLSVDLDACLPLLRSSRQLLVVIPTARENHPRIMDLLRDAETLNRLRRIHRALGEALREEQMTREFGLVTDFER